MQDWGKITERGCCYTPYRDEKRTESPYEQGITALKHSVTLPTAMKSGLKVPCAYPFAS